MAVDYRIRYPGVGKGGVSAMKTHCPQNHPYDAENTYVNPYSGKRLCRQCMRASSLRRYYRLRAERNRMKVDWTTTWHEAQTDERGACRLCGATANKAIHDESFARSRGHEFVRTT